MRPGRDESRTLPLKDVLCDLLLRRIFFCALILPPPSSPAGPACPLVDETHATQPTRWQNVGLRLPCRDIHHQNKKDQRQAPSPFQPCRICKEPFTVEFKIWVPRDTGSSALPGSIKRQYPCSSPAVGDPRPLAGKAPPRLSSPPTPGQERPRPLENCPKCAKPT